MVWEEGIFSHNVNYCHLPDMEEGPGFGLFLGGDTEDNVLVPDSTKHKIRYITSDLILHKNKYYFFLHLISYSSTCSETYRKIAQIGACAYIRFYAVKSENLPLQKLRLLAHEPSISLYWRTP